MLTFIISFVLTAIICMCFFKKNFWENRYLVLLIGSGVALIATLATNFSVRGNLQTRTEVVSIKPMKLFYVELDSIKKRTNTDSCSYIIKNYNYYAEDGDMFDKDTTKNQVPRTILVYNWGKRNQYLMVGYMNKRGNQDYYNVSDVYFVRSSADSVAYVSKKRLFYDPKSNNWITGLSLPRKSTITILHVPPTEFALIPDSLIRPIPF